jgi:hypothetical protein
LHRVVDREPRGDHPSRRIHVELHVLVRVFALQEQELGHDDVGDVVVDFCPQKNDPVFQ